MYYRKLGNTGYDVSVVGFGMWQLGGGRWQAQNRAESVRILCEARDEGVNIFDSAVVYGQYADMRGQLQSRSQELLGKAFQDRRSEVIYCVKLGQFDEYSHRADYAASRIVDQLRQSLRRLRTDYIDICLIHAPSLHEVKSGKALGILQTLQALGMVRMIGYSFENEPEHVNEALKQRIDVLMLQYNLLDQECGDAIEAAHERGVGVLIGGPLKRGYLSGKFRTLDDLPQEDDYWKWNLNLNSQKTMQLLERVQQLLVEHRSPRELRRAALQFILSRPGASSAIVGHRMIHEVRENIQSVCSERRVIELQRYPSSDQRVIEVLGMRTSQV